MLILDTREAKLIELIKSISGFKIPYTIENLQIGDIIIRHTIESNSNSSKTYNIILERKCMTDMIASIKDGRYKEQKIRLLSEVSKNTTTIQSIICYLLEGSQNELHLPQDKTMLNGSIISSIFRDKIPILRTYTLQETVDIISRLHDRMLKDITDFFPSLSETSNNTNATAETEIILETPANNNPENNLYLQSIKKCKKDNITPKLWNQMCYMNIPGISSNIAIKIAEVYPTLKSLLDAYTKCSTETEKELLIANIILTETEKQKRRIGEIISKRVKEYIF
jgi:crossover junction endonuclease MUS81